MKQIKLFTQATDDDVNRWIRKNKINVLKITYYCDRESKAEYFQVVYEA